MRRTAIAGASLAAFMLALAFAAVPLYDLFCRVTGFGGAPMVSAANPSVSLGRPIEVRFDAGVAPGLDWRFTPEAPAITLRLGETVTMQYLVRNAGPTETVGVSTFNVSPPLAGQYFNKLACFCFTDTPLKPGESRETTVTFFVDPALAKDKDIANLRSITLSYTFFPAKTAPGAATKSVADAPSAAQGRL